MSDNDKYLLEQYKKKLMLMMKSNNNRKETIRWLSQKLEMENLMPSRTTSLSPDEELEGCINTWGMWDRVMWMSAFGNEKQLLNDIADPEKWINNRESTVIVMEDEVPVWIKMGISKKVIPRTHALHKKKVVRTRRALRKTTDPKMRSILMSSFGDGMTQLRNKQVGDEKFRITVVMRQAILHYFDESKKPRGIQLPPIVVMPGVHARISNISPDGKWVEDEVIKVGQKTIIRNKNEKVDASIMKQWRKIRSLQPDLVASVVLMQQPAAWRDEVITSWSYHDLHDRMQKEGFHNIIMVHDLVGHQLTQNVRKIKYLHNIMQSIIAAEMTAVLQLTDIRAAKMMKEFLHHSKLKMRQMLAEKAASEHAEARYKVGGCEMLWMIRDATKKMDEKLEKNDWIISGAREVGWLAWRPSLKKQELVWVDEDENQEWAKDHIMSSHRIHAEWMAKRSDLHTDANGVPLMPEWIKESEKQKSPHCLHKYIMMLRMKL